MRLKQLFFVILILIPLAAFAKTADEMRAQNTQLAEYYRAAMDSFYREDYTAAIRQWEEITRIDPQQTQAQQLIEFARQKMVEKMKPLSAEVSAYIESGKYGIALSKNTERLALDSTNAKWKQLSEKLEKVSKIFIENTEAGKPFDLARKSIYAFLSEKEDPRYSLNACRYAWQLKPGDARFKDLKEMMEMEYIQLAQSERLIAGTDLVDQKLQSVLSSIYEGKYDRAILECNDVLALEPNNVVAMKRGGSAYYASGNKKQAIEIWKRAAALAPGDAELKKFSKMK